MTAHKRTYKDRYLEIANKCSDLTLPVPPDRPNNAQCCRRGCVPCVYDYYHRSLTSWMGFCANAQSLTNEEFSKKYPSFEAFIKDEQKINYLSEETKLKP